MNLLFALLLATAFAAGSDDEVVQRVHARIADYDVVAGSCRDVFADVAEPGSALFDFQYQITGTRRGDRYEGKVTFTLGTVTIRVPHAIAWKDMNGTDRERANALRNAIYHHEVGHVRIAEAVRDALNAGDAVSAPDRAGFSAAAQAFGREGFARFKREEREYDALTDHGRNQHSAPGELAGRDTVLQCR